MHKGFLLTWLYVLPSALSSLAAVLLVWFAATFLASLPQGGEQAAFSISIYALVLAQIGALLTLFFGGAIVRLAREAKSRQLFLCRPHRRASRSTVPAVLANAASSSSLVSWHPGSASHPLLGVAQLLGGTALTIRSSGPLRRRAVT